jgi:hypothetical protein
MITDLTDWTPRERPAGHDAQARSTDTGDGQSAAANHNTVRVEAA